MAEALKPLDHLEKLAKNQFEIAQKEYAQDIGAHNITKEAQIAKIKKGLKTQESLDQANIKNQLQAISTPESPIWKRFKTNDATIEKLTELLEDNPKGLLLYRDELIGLLANWDKEGHESDRAFFLEAWNGYGSHTTDRIGRD